MTKSTNPYESPKLTDIPETLWAKLRRILIGTGTYQKRRDPIFVNGDAILYEGIAFYIDTNNLSTLFASSPSIDHGDARMQFIIEETTRLLPAFLAEHLELQEILLHRTICVKITEAYDGCQTSIIRQTVLPNTVSSLVGQLTNDNPDG